MPGANHPAPGGGWEALPDDEKRAWKGVGDRDRARRTHREYVGEGYSVTIQHCEQSDCGAYLGVNYPSRYCDGHEEG